MSTAPRTTRHTSAARRRKAAAARRFPLPPPLLLVALGALFLISLSGYAVATHLEENDGFCASCHSQPETTFFDRSQAAQPVDLASMHHGVHTLCIDCHAGPGVPGRLAALTVGAGDLLAFVSGSARQPAPLTVPIADANCLKCHGDVPRAQAFQRHFHAFLARWQAADPTAAGCVDCHSAHSTSGGADLKWMQQQQVQAVCERCHAAIGER